MDLPCNNMKGQYVIEKEKKYDGQDQLQISASITFVNNSEY